jgi:UDP-GlcNAc:undecaprenyl-phosphate/decaprenyl-phosphate GlcNAc-1-phosphate transferase
MKSFTDITTILYLWTFGIALIFSLLLTPLFRRIAIKFGVLDHPHTDIKTHRIPTPYLGGVAIWLGWVASLSIIRIFSHFPSGTLRSLRGLLIGSTLVLLIGLFDDIIPGGLSFKKKFLFQGIAAVALLFFDIRLHFLSPYLVAAMLSIIWVIGISNAFNIIDIMDGLSSGIAVIASVAFLLIALPSEQIYVNFCSAALAGSCLGFIPFNLSKKRKIFMGDTGSLTIGFILAGVAMGTSYTKANDIGLISPLLILAIPIYDTILVMYIRWLKGRSPFLGSKDHFALRLEKMGFNRKQILVVTYLASAILSFGAYLVTRFNFINALIVFLVILALGLITSVRLGRVKMD